MIATSAKTVIELAGQDNEGNTAELRGTATQSDIVRGAQQYPNATPAELANRLHTSESYVRDVLNRVVL